MKNTFKLFGIAVIITVIGFSFAACNEGGGDRMPPILPRSSNAVTYKGYDASGKLYTLKITKAAGKYTAVTGDNYILTIDRNISEGKVTNIVGSIYTLEPGGSYSETTFNITIDGNSISKITGTITFKDGTTEVTDNKPLAPTRPGSGSGGTFTITGIPSQYNGKYVSFAATGGTLDNDEYVVSGFQSYNAATETFTLSRISGGRVSIPMWKTIPDYNQELPIRYSGNDSDCDVAFIICEEATMRPGYTLTTKYVAVINSVSFRNGSGSKSWGDISTGSDIDIDGVYSDGWPPSGTLSKYGASGMSQPSGSEFKWYDTSIPQADSLYISFKPNSGTESSLRANFSSGWTINVDMTSNNYPVLMWQNSSGVMASYTQSTQDLATLNFIKMK